LNILQHQIKTGLNAPPTSSIGRLFDAVAALIGVQQRVNYEAQAAIELESLVDPEETGLYPYHIAEAPLLSNYPDKPSCEIDPSPMIHMIIKNMQDGVRTPTISARFHNSLAQMVLLICQAMRDNSGINRVALSGGVWQNMTLLGKTVKLLSDNTFMVYMHQQVPPNDGGLALGQAIIAVHKSGWR
jgi:hydrogenase maturation protein HypF